ncbi:MAG: hypothetical protein QW265_05330 [Candidatus Bathyarchaeia archaeon]
MRQEIGLFGATFYGVGLILGAGICALVGLTKVKIREILEEGMGKEIFSGFSFSKEMQK